MLFRYEITYNANLMTINTSERFYKRYSEDYDEFVDFCEELNIAEAELLRVIDGYS